MRSEVIDTGNKVVRVTAVNHACIDIACDPSVVWHYIVVNFIEGAEFLRQGYEIEALDNDPAAFLGGYRMQLPADDGGLTDERIVRLTERNDSARRLSMCAEYREPTDMALIVNVTYQAVPTDRGTRYELHSHSNYSLPADAASDPHTVGAMVQDFVDKASAFLNRRMQVTKHHLEASPTATGFIR